MSASGSSLTCRRLKDEIEILVDDDGPGIRPDALEKIFERFYRLKPGLIERFYAGLSTGGDKARILTGKPPVPVGKALKALQSRKKAR